MIPFDARKTGLLVCLLSLPFILGQARSSGPGRLDRFVDATARAGLTFTHQSGATPEKRMVETFGSGVAWIDYDNDGFPDLYFVNGAPGAPSALYHNNKDGTFSDVTARAGLAGNSCRAASVLRGEGGPSSFGVCAPHEGGDSTEADSS